MKIILKVLLLSVGLVFSFIGVTSVDLRAQDDFKTYENERSGYKILYPSHWQLNTTRYNDTNGEYPLKIPGIKIGTETAIQINPVNRTVPIFIIDVFKFDAEGRGSNLSSVDAGDEVFADVVSSVATIIGENLDIVESRYGTLSGEPIYRIRALGDDLDITTIFLSRDDRIYNLEYHTNRFDYPVYFPLLNKMTESFQFTNSTS